MQTANASPFHVEIPGQATATTPVFFLFFFQKLKTQEWALGGDAASKVAPKKSTLENMKNLKSCLERLVKKKVKKMKTWRDFMED